MKGGAPVLEHKGNRSSVWYFAALALLLCIAFFVISVSPAFARYREDIPKGIVFEVREPEHICFGSFNEEEFVPFTDSGDIKWEVSENTASLTLTVANGSSGTKYFSKDQKINIQLAAGPEFKEKEVKLTFSENGVERTIPATAKDISEDSTFDKSYGAGFVFSFFENEEEFSYVLKGGEFSFFTFTITANVEGLDGISLLQPHVVAEVIQ